ncbi:MAG: asparagine--tRNA ligase [Rickettsiales bacterium]|nr:asparagine--tRNA ligase [Rickettsiales bacterium]|tara:strand:+ start:1899 stop:3257 length:1359 start_codon:yes stop_codon:yes gene_type:complete
MSPHPPRRQSIREILSAVSAGTEVHLTGWVRNKRVSKAVAFLELNDGSMLSNLQLVFPADGLGPQAAEPIGKGSAIAVTGTICPSQGKGQKWEVQVSTIQLVGDCPDDYPLQTKRHSFEFLREKAHLRPRTRTFSAVFRVRNALAMAIHNFFQQRGFLWIHTPIIAASDCEGAGDLFEIKATEAENFFGSPTYLTVSGQLNVEGYASAYTDVYTFGPTFRAENSHTARHAAEFWMVEPEIAFANLNDLLDLAEDFIRMTSAEVHERCAEDMEFFDRWIEKGVIEKVRSTLARPFERMTYSDAIAALKNSGRSFEYPVEWGVSLQTEHERYLAEEFVGGPVFVTDYPTDQKAFYMRLSDDGKTVAATDLLVPRLGEIIGGSQREERADVLSSEMKRRGLESAPYWWYQELRRYGTTPHAGFGLGFERLLMYLTGMQNIRDVIPYPRTPGQADF